MSQGTRDLLAPTPAWQGWLRSLALPLSLAAHALAAFAILSLPPRAHADAAWIEMAVVAPPPPPAPELPPPEPEPERRKERPPTPEAVAFEDTVPEAPEDGAAEPPPEQPRAVRRIQGLSASSFAAGSGTGISVRRGTTTAAAAGSEHMALGEQDGFDLLPVAAATTQPRGCTRPPVEVPKEAITAAYEGTLRMTLDLDAEGRVVGVAFADHADFGVEDACRAAALQMRCRPARQGEIPVGVTGMPHRCTIKALD